MKKSKLYEVWCGLPSDSQQLFEKYLLSKGNLVRSDVLLLSDYLIKNKNCDGDIWKKETVFAAVYGAEKPYHDDTMRHIQSFLTKEIEQFLVAQEYSQNASHETLALAKVYRRLKLEKPFQQTMRRLGQLQAEEKIRDASALQLAAAAENVWITHQTEQSRSEVSSLQTLLDAEEKAFAAAKLRSVCSALSYQSLSKTSHDFGLLEALLTRVEEKKWAETEASIGAYYFIYRMNTSAESKLFFEKLRQNLTAYRAHFEPEEYLKIYLGAVNYSIKQSNQGDEEFFRQLFELYKNGIETSILLVEDGTLSPYTYKNMTATGLRIGESDYIFSFIEKYRKFLPVEFRQNYYEYNLARYYFATQNFEKAMPMLNKLTYGDIFLQLGAKVMLLKMYYQLDEYDALDAFLRSFQQFLHRKKASLSYHQQNYLNIIHCTKQLMVTNGFDKIKSLKLREEISALQPLTEREWLLKAIKN